VRGISLTADVLTHPGRMRLGPGERRAVDRVARLAARTERMIEDLLDLFQVTSSPERASWVDLKPLVRQVVGGLAPDVGAKGVRIDVADLPTVWGQPEKLRHVLSHLITNAVAHVPARQGLVQVSGVVEDAGVALHVRDNGVGIPACYQERIFDVFRKVPRAQESDGTAGTGVGLAVVKWIVERHGGAVTVESSPGVGSCFTVRLPALPAGRCPA
jgi:signal transduction histidine kinase